MKLNNDCVLVLPDVFKNESLMGDVIDYCTGEIKAIAENIKKEFPFEVGDTVHYTPMSGYKVHLDKKEDQYHIVHNHKNILLKQ